MIAEKQESRVQLNQLIDALFASSEPWPVAVSAAFPLANGKPLDDGNDTPSSKDVLPPLCGRLFSSPLVRTLCYLLKQALHLKLAGHAFA
jgi:hypothetical protein